ncbi:hypothetical protein ACM44_05685 [Chryseobacterium koreense CCUG 49689]|uniref:Uncharacterized protein n=2 Tax=Chryseobacterium koreense TaxID=232216 RepID=A0A0J7J0W7_9FLAO|nr:hypothetical protein ACM44_05685 [Chryseobacterium koreense CCUG 49689]
MVEELKKNYYSKCDIDEKRAAEDAKTKTIYYINLPAPSSYNFLQGVELEEILKKDDIIFGGSWMGSDLPFHYTQQECYKYFMTKNAEEKFGEKYFEAKIDEALKIFIKNNPERIFDSRFDELDHKPILLGTETFQEQRNIIEDGFWKKYNLPKGYANRKTDELYSYVSAYFILDQNGKISNLQVEAEFQNPKNSKFRQYFEESLKKYITTLKWQAKTYQGYNVKSRDYVSIYLP